MVLSCDLPFVNDSVATFLLEKTLQFDAAVPKWPNGNIEPLHSAFNVAEAKSATEKTLLMGQLRVSHMIDRLRNVAYVNVEEMRKLDNDLLTFFNVNTKTDLRKAEKIMKAL
jgi:molybdopterin-guanine dinucleotide biosynthesis protein A